MTSGEHVQYTKKITSRFAGLLGDLSPWYGPARKVSEAISAAMPVDDETSIWKGGDNPLDVDQRAFAVNITNLVNSTLNGKLAIVHRVKANLEILAYMVKWHMTVSAGTLYGTAIIIFFIFSTIVHSRTLQNSLSRTS